MSAIVRGALVVVGVLLMLGGLALIVVAPGIGAGRPGWSSSASARSSSIVVAIERQRYRSAAAEPTNAAPGPGGGEPAGAKLEPRFRPTDRGVHRSDDRASRCASLVDPATGERRYVAAVVTVDGSAPPAGEPKEIEVKLAVARPRTVRRLLVER